MIAKQYEGLYRRSLMLNTCHLEEFQEEVKYKGYYVHDFYYCVWTEGEKAEDIAETKEHEICHALIEKEYNHYCLSVA